VKKILVLIMLLIVSCNVIANTWVNHTYSETDWTIFHDMSYNGYNVCRAYLDVNFPNNSDDYIESAIEDTYPDWQLIVNLSYGPTNYCNVSLDVYGTVADLNVSINYTHSGNSTIYGPNSSEYSEGEGYYNYDVRSINHVNYTSVCGDSFYCIIDVINNTDNSTLYIQVVSGYYGCSTVPPYSFTLLYDGVSMHNNNQTFHPIGGGYYRSNLSIPNAIPCSNGYIHSCYIEIYNDTDNSTLYIGNLSAADGPCPQISLYLLPNGNFGTLPGLNGSGGNMSGNGSIQNTTGLGSSILGLPTNPFLKYFAFLLTIVLLLSCKPFKLGAAISAAALDFFALVLVWDIMTGSVILIYNFIAASAWFTEGKQ